MREGTFFNLWKKGESRKTNDFVLLHFLSALFESRPARDCGAGCRGKIKRINQPTALALTRVNVLVCQIQKLSSTPSAHRIKDGRRVYTYAFMIVSSYGVGVWVKFLSFWRRFSARNFGNAVSLDYGIGDRSFYRSCRSIYIYIYKYKSDEMLIFLSFFLFFCCRRIEKICILFENTQL